MKDLAPRVSPFRLTPFRCVDRRDMDVPLCCPNYVRSPALISLATMEYEWYSLDTGSAKLLHK
ncbi:MAG: hypothetical protein ABSH06_22755 [Thermodesulfobacteriota bacterium]